MGWTVSLLTGVAERLAAAGVAAWSPDPDTVYAADEVGITFAVIPQAPDRIVCLTAYPVVDTPGLVDVTVGIQVRCRGTADPDVVSDLADAVYDVLQGLAGVELGGVAVSQMYRQSSAPLGPDQAGRHERSDNYYAQASRPTSNNTD